MVTQSPGTDLRTVLKRMPYTLRVGNIPGGDTEFIDIQAAADYAATQGGNWTIFIHPGAYASGIDLTAAPGVNLCGLDKENCIITVNDGEIGVTMGAGCSARNLTFNVTVTGTTSIGVECGDASCTIEDCNFVLQRTGGVVAIGIDENTDNTAQTIYIRNVRMHSLIDTNITCIYIQQDNKTVYIENSWCEAGDRGLRVTAISTVYSTNNYWEALDDTVSIALEAAGAIYLHNDTLISPLVQTAGTLESRESHINTINCTGGTITAYGGTIEAITRAATSVVWWGDDYTIKVLPSGTITDTVITYALAAALAAARRITIRLAPGDYEEDNMALVDDVNIVGEGHTAASGSHITINSANPIFTADAVQTSLRHIRITQAGAGAVFVINNAAAIVHTDGCVFGSTAGNSITMTAGTYSTHGSTINSGNINMSTAACSLILHGGSMNGNIVTAGAFAHNIDITSVNMNGNNITNNATGATTISIIKCYDVGAFTDAGLVGTVVIESTIMVTATKSGTSPWTVRLGEFGFLSNTNATGAITAFGGLIYALARAVGPIIWWDTTNTLKVLPCTTITDTIIQWAVNAAGASDTVLIYPGTYEEAVVLAAGINLVGIDKESCIINIDHATLITMAAGSYVSNLTLDVTADATGNGIGVECNDQACTIEDLIIYVTRTANIGHAICDLTAGTARTIYIRNVRVSQVGAGIVNGIYTTQDGKTFYVENCYVECETALYIAGVSTVHSTQNHWEGVVAVYLLAAGNIYLHQEAIVGLIDQRAGVLLYRDADETYQVWPGMSAQNAVDDIATNENGGEIYLHPGIHIWTAQLDIDAADFADHNCRITIRGAGKGTIITTDTADLDIIYCHGTDGDELEGLILRDFVVDGNLGGVACDIGIHWDYVDYSKIINVQVRDTSEYGIRLLHCDNDQLANCQAAVAGTGFYCISLSNCTWIKILHPIALNGVSQGIALTESTDCEITSPTIRGAGSDGIWIYLSDRITIIGPQCDGNTTRGIRIQNSEFTVISGGQCNNNGSHGVGIDGAAAPNQAGNNVVTGMICTGNTGQGVDIAGGANADRNIITSCYLLGNTAGALLDNGANTQVGLNVTV